MEIGNYVGDSLSDFTIEKPIGNGHFSSVYRAYCTWSKNRVALKKISLLHKMEEKCYEDFLKEASLLQRISHPNVIKCFTSFIEDSDLIIVLELAEAGDIAKMIKDFSDFGYLIPEKTIWRYFVQVTCAISHIHHKKIMHRDIKPANIFITTNGVVKLGDLGLGRLFSTNTSKANSLLGTPYYMSPERVKESDYDFKSDIWSLGCLLYEMAALQSPFYCRQTNLAFIFKRIDNALYPPIPSDSYSDELKRLVDTCLEKDKEMRPESEDVHRFAQSMCQKFNNPSKLSF